MSAEELSWFKSSYSSGGGGECLEIATCAQAVHLRDSKRPADPHVTLSAAAWGDFLTSVTK
ncbi:DUF397 domain-containing protein [Streptomyces sp. NPDC002888]|uniref:DUF397 domain-containing protein n=1 Tax=Streptomyces sp. NPDC002888 TaxID=3364668 RepID=UPI0036D0C8BD